MKEDNARLKATGMIDPDYMPPSNHEDVNDDESLDSFESPINARSQVELQHDSTRVLKRMTLTPNRCRRGISRELDIQRLVDKSGKLLVPIPQEYRTPVGIYASKLACKIGVEVRAQVQDRSVKSWKAMDEGIKAPLLQSRKHGLISMFQVLCFLIFVGCNKTKHRYGTKSLTVRVHEHVGRLAVPTWFSLFLDLTNGGMSMTAKIV
ncbi:hypothetical protein RHSIM_Rhsim03G0114400 [Rhododendron simsii]|uniref:Uncharacterized protein n=1 Tax=Rhododendron simsii TaxID=118357 RepID=A0A834H682_RHOSS|nr:hypothetical protein RHSIM_Rhsim03G0114400 [Rhododendron simsii]